MAVHGQFEARGVARQPLLTLQQLLDRREGTGTASSACRWVARSPQEAAASPRGSLIPRLFPQITAEVNSEVGSAAFWAGSQSQKVRMHAQGAPRLPSACPAQGGSSKRYHRSREMLSPCKLPSVLSCFFIYLVLGSFSYGRDSWRKVASGRLLALRHSKGRMSSQKRMASSFDVERNSVPHAATVRIPSTPTALPQTWGAPPLAGVAACGPGC